MDAVRGWLTTVAVNHPTRDSSPTLARDSRTHANKRSVRNLSSMPYYRTAT